MEPNADESKAPESKPGSKPNAKDDLKSLPMPELQAKLGSSPDGLSQAEARRNGWKYDAVCVGYHFRIRDPGRIYHEKGKCSDCHIQYSRRG